VSRQSSNRAPAPPGAPAPQTSGSQDAEAGELVRAAEAGDAGAWEALVDRFSGMVWSIARANGLDRVDAADVAQTVWLRLVDHLHALRDPDRVGGWLAATARHESIRVSRQRQRNVPTDDPAVFDRSTGADDDPVRGLLRRERDAALRELVADLPDRGQDLLELLMAEPAMSYAEVATHLGIPVGSIGPTRQRCLRSVRTRAAVVGIEP
jgi:RNA polymerase sigma factor (sigma-70 family)